MKPTISVIMSVHNQSEYLPDAIESLLHQTYKNFELIFIDDGSTDNTWKILNKYKTKQTKLIKHLKKQGLAKSLNQGIKISTGKYIARMDADDISYPQRLEKQLSCLEQNPNVAICGTAADLINRYGQIIGTKKFPQKPKSVIMRYNPLIHSSAMIRKNILNQVGKYDESLNGAEDYDLWLRLGAKFDLINLSETLMKYRINPQGISWRKLKHVEWQSLRCRFKALTKYDYPKWQLIYTLKPALSFVFPAWVKKKFFHVE